MTAIPTALPAFYPEQTSTLACTTTSGSTNVTLGSVGDTLMLKNEGPSTAFVAFGDAGVTATAGGTADAMTLTYSPALASYTTNQTFVFYKNGSDNTGAATLNINGLGAKAIVKRDGSTALGAADMKANALYVVTYDGTSFRLHFTGI